MLDNDIASLLEEVDEIEKASKPFQNAISNNRSDEAHRLSKSASRYIKSVVIGIRTLQDAGRCAKVTGVVGLWVKNATKEQCQLALSSRKIEEGSALELREALNKFAHVSQATFNHHPEHRMILVGELGDKNWVVDISVVKFCEVARDVLTHASPAS